MNPVSKFGILFFSITSLAVFVLKVMTAENIYTGSSFYQVLKGISTVLPILWGVSLVMIIGPLIKSYLIVLVVFAGTVAVGYIALAPIFLGGIHP